MNTILILLLLLFLLIITYFCYIENFKNNSEYKIKLIIHERPDYLPLMLFTNSLYSSLKKVSNVELIKDFKEITDYNNIILICFIFDLKEDMIEKIKEFNIKTILINTEYYLSSLIHWKLDLINKESKNYIISEYSSSNYKNMNVHLPNLNIFYGPLLYNDYLIEYYNENVENKINIKDKEIDIYFFGYVNERRGKIIHELEKKYKVVYYNTYITNKQLLNNIENSKIILNINQHDTHNVFDYYRNSFLIANKIFFIYEHPTEIDFSVDKNLIGIKENMIVPEYDNILETIDYYMENYNEDLIKNQVEKQYNWFRNFTLDDNINNYILEN